MTRHGFGVVVVALFAGGCEITVDKGFASGDTGTDSLPTTETGDTVGTPTGETGDSVTDPDADGDGFPASTDCVDTDPAIHPGADEACDGVDNDCDNYVDDAHAATIGATSYDSLDEALDAAVDGDRVDVCPGVHTVSPHTWDGGTLTVRGLSDRAATTIQSDATGAAFTVDDAELHLAALTVQGIPDRTSSERLVVVQGGGVFELVNGGLVDNGMGALWLDETNRASVSLVDSVVSGNGVPADAYVEAMPAEGGGIYAYGDFDLTLTGTTVENNVAGDGGGLHVTNIFGVGTLTLDGATITGNEAAGAGGGLYVAKVVTTGSNGAAATGNTAMWGGGLAVLKAEVTGLLVSGNTGVESGGGVYVAYDALFAPLPDSELTGVIVDTNSAGDGGAIWADDGFSLDATSAVTLNASTVGVAAVGCPVGDFTMVSDGADFGAAATYNDNTPADVGVMGGTYAYDGPATFTCACDGTCD